MRESGLEQEMGGSNIKTHEEILEMIEEIKEFERKFEEIEIVEREVEPEFIEIEHETLEEFQPIPIKEEVKEPTLRDRLKKNPIFRIKFRTRSEVKEIKASTPATFRLRLNEQGELVNIDIKKPKPKQKKEPKAKKSSKIKKFGLRRKGKEENKESETEAKTSEEGKSRFSKLKGGFGKIGKLKRAIPSKKKKEEETEEKET